MQLEKDVEGYLVRQVGKLGGQCVKFLPDIENGFPDRLVLLPGGVSVWVELKNGTSEKTRRLQRMQHQKLRKLGQRVEVVQTKEAVDVLLRDYSPG